MSDTKPNLTTALGGTMFTAHLLDGATEEVKIRQLPIRALVGQWARLQGDEAGLVELYCDKEEGWADTILPDDHDEIVKIGGELNRPRFARWAVDRRADIAEFKEMTKGIVPEAASTSPSSSSPAAAS